MNKLANDVLKNQRYYLSKQVESNDTIILYNYIPFLLMDNATTYLSTLVRDVKYSVNPSYRFMIDIANLLRIAKKTNVENRFEMKAELIRSIKKSALEVGEWVDATHYFFRYRNIVDDLFREIPDFENSLNYDALTRDRTTRKYNLAFIMNILKEDINNPNDGIEKFLEDTLYMYPAYILGNSNLYITDISTGRTSGVMPHQFIIEDKDYSLAEVFYICAYFMLFDDKDKLINACKDIFEINTNISKFMSIDVSSALESYTVLQNLTCEL